MSKPTHLSVYPILNKVHNAASTRLPIHLVGGAVRDAITDREVRDLDFVMPEKALTIARRVADYLDGAFYTLDQERNTGRVILDWPYKGRIVMDFAVYQGPDLESDLQMRDFTVNAMAMDIRPPHSLVDPLDGLVDLGHKRLRACSPGAFESDPVRVLRGVRLAADYHFRILPDTREKMRQASHLISAVSVERLRDELFRILESPRPATSIRALDMLDALEHVVPELLDLKDLEQPTPHILDAWNHSLDILHKLETILAVLGPKHDPEASAGLHLGLLALQLGRYRQQLESHMTTSLNVNRSHRALLNLAALYHDVGKPATKEVDEDGRIHFYDHESVGAGMITKRAKKLHLSIAEVDRLSTIVKHHMRPLWLAQTGKPPSKKAIYRFFRDADEAGVDICLLSLADTMATYGPTLSHETWNRNLNVIRALLEAWWEHRDERVSPPRLISGHDLIVELDLEPGPQIGQILEAVTEAQIANQVQTRGEALELSRKLLDDFRK